LRILNHLFQDIFKDDFLKYKEKQEAVSAICQWRGNGIFHMDAVPK